MKRGKRLAALLLALCMTLGMTVETALADWHVFGEYEEEFPWGRIYYERAGDFTEEYSAHISGDGITALPAIIEQDLLREIDEGDAVYPVYGLFIAAPYLVQADFPDNMSQDIWYVSLSGSNLTEVTIPDSIREVRLYDAPALCNIDWGSGVEVINIYGNIGLTSLECPNSVKKVNITSGCSSLSRLSVPSGIQKIWGRGAENLRDVYYDGTMAEWSKIDYDFGDDAAITVHCKDGAAPLGSPELNELRVSFSGTGEISMLPGETRKLDVFLGVLLLELEGEGNDIIIFDWSSSDENICTVTEGVVTAVGPGTAEITVVATFYDNYMARPLTGMATCTVTVEGPAAGTPRRVDFYPNGGVITSIKGFPASQIAAGSTTAQENGIFVDEYSGIGMMMTNANGMLDSFPVVEREGYTLEGWYIVPSSGIEHDAVSDLTGYTRADSTTQYTSDVNLVAKWTKVETAAYTVTFHLNGLSGTVPGPQTVAAGEAAVLPALILPAEYRFLGWGYSTDGQTLERWEENWPVTGDLHLYALWERTGSPAARVDGVDYTTLQEAVDAVADGGVIEILSNAEMSATVSRAVTFTLRPGGSEIPNTVHATVEAGASYELEVTYAENGVSIYMVVPEVVHYADPAAVFVFEDIPTGHWAEVPVQWAIDSGITNGTSVSTFTPDRTCTRAEIITFLWRAAGSPDVQGQGAVSDVPSGVYYEGAAAWAASNGLFSGSAFSPDAPCTREMAVEFMWRFAGCPDAASAGFVDVSSDAVDWATEAGITIGTDPEGTTFSPERTCTRAEIVTFLYRGFAG